jgi:DNA-binding NarL/FixJ family response regulator
MKTSKIKTIFVVDDNKLFLKGAKGFLERRLDSKVKCFSNVSDCVKSLNQNPDLIFMDYNFQPNSQNRNATGSWAVKKIRTQDKKTPIIMVSSQQEPSLVAKVMQSGVTDYLQKSPMSFFNMRDKVLQLEKKSRIIDKSSKLKLKIFLLIGLLTAGLIIFSNMIN